MAKRITVIATLILALFLIQNAVPYASLPLKADLLLLFVIAASFLGEGIEGITIGLICGAFIDFASTSGFGFYTLLGLCAALLARMFNQRLFKNNVLVFILMTIYVSAAYQLLGFLLYNLIGVLNGGRFSDFAGFSRFLIAYASPAVLANGIAAIFMFFLVRGMFIRRKVY